MNIIKKGDWILTRGVRVQVDVVYYQYWDDTLRVWDVEFMDTNGKHRHWKQFYDYGNCTRGEAFNAILIKGNKII